MKRWIAVPIALVLWMLPAQSRAQTRTPDRVAVLTMGPGDHPFAKFGHNAIVVEWQRERLALVYNFGTFSFEGLEGIRDFMAGRFRYWLSVSTLPRTLRAYAAQRRSVVAQDLELTEEERREIALALDINALPENAAYDYDYYYDNCSTRVRDAVDKVLDGAIVRQIRNEPGRLTFRQHTLRLTADSFWVYFGLDIALGPNTDRPTTRLSETFIPEELQKALRGARRADGRPVVKHEAVLVTTDRPPERSDPPNRVPGFALFGLALGAGIAALGRVGAKKRAARVGFAIVTALLGFLLGLLGIVFFVFWAFTKHWSAHQNFNLLVFTPWAIALVVTQVGVARGKSRASERSLRIIAASTVTALIAMLLALIPHFGQDNTRVAALLGPVWLGIYAGSRWLESKLVLPQFIRERKARVA